MAEYDDEMRIQFLQRSYKAADGLWFMCVEKERSFEEALRLDELVWAVMPKIQCRKARELLGISEGSLHGLADALGLKLDSEGFKHHVTVCSDRLLVIETGDCPWLKALETSGRREFAREICTRICEPEMGVWAREFSPEIRFSFDCRASDGARCCKMCFTRTSPP